MISNETEETNGKQDIHVPAVPPDPDDKDIKKLDVPDLIWRDSILRGIKPN